MLCQCRVKKCQCRAFPFVLWKERKKNQLFPQLAARHSALFLLLPLLLPPSFSLFSATNCCRYIPESNSNGISIRQKEGERWSGLCRATTKCCHQQAAPTELANHVFCANAVQSGDMMEFFSLYLEFCANGIFVPCRRRRKRCCWFACIARIFPFRSCSVAAANDKWMERVMRGQEENRKMPRQEKRQWHGMGGGNFCSARMPAFFFYFCAIPCITLLLVWSSLSPLDHPSNRRAKQKN